MSNGYQETGKISAFVNLLALHVSSHSAWPVTNARNISSMMCHDQGPELASSTIARIIRRQYWWLCRRGDEDNREPVKHVPQVNRQVTFHFDHNDEHDLEWLYGHKQRREGSANPRDHGSRERCPLSPGVRKRGDRPGRNSGHAQLLVDSYQSMIGRFLQLAKTTEAVHMT